MMNKADLRTGMVVKVRDGGKYIALVGDLTTDFHGKQSIILVNIDGFYPMDTYSNNMKHPRDSDFDVVAVYQPDICGVDAMLDDPGTPLWTRQPEVDWSKVAVDTKVFICDDNETWTPRYFCKFKDGRVYTWDGGATSFSQDGSTSWNYAKLA